VSLTDVIVILQYLARVARRAITLREYRLKPRGQ
jgi:hypothetical protein